MNPRPPKGTESRGAEASPKKPYAEPVLVDMGSFKDLTLATGSQGATDGGHQNRRKNTRS
jgi:hypothetical protein